MPRLSILIVSYNTRDLTLDCLRSVKRWEPDAEVIVVDNGSTDGSPEAIYELFPNVLLIPSENNLGFAGANNLAYERATGEYVVLLNSDTALTDAALTTCCDYMDGAVWLGATSPRLMGADGRPQRAAHRFPTCHEVVAKTLRRDPKKSSAPKPPHYLAGTCLVLRREAVRQAGGLFAPNLYFYWEDADLSSRLLSKGWRLEVVQDACVTHHGGASGGGPDARRRPDLHAWYMFGRHEWFCRHRPRWESCAVWGLELLDTVRMSLRGIVRPSRRHEIAQARQVARVLVGRLRGRTPARLA